MFSVKECTPSGPMCDMCGGFAGDCPLIKKLCGKAEDGDRIFILYEDAPLAAGVLGLKGGKVIVKGVFGNIDQAYRDLMFRSLLHVCRCLNPICVRVEAYDEYFLRFGFKEINGGMEILNTQIKF